MLANAKLQTIVLTSNIETAEVFYRETLGLTVTDRTDGAVVFNVGGSTLRLSPVPSTAPTEHTVVGFAVSNVKAVITQLIQRGITLERFEGFPHDKLGMLTTPDGSQVAWFRDQDGNLMSVVEFKN